MRPGRRIGAAAVLVAAACAGSSPTVPAPTDHDAEGSWERNTDGLPAAGNSFIVTLRESAGAIAGTGTYAGEAGPQGTLAVSGTIARDSLRLAIVFIPDPVLLPLLKPDTGQFVGALTTRDRIDGTLTVDTIARTLGLVRLASP